MIFYKRKIILVVLIILNLVPLSSCKPRETLVEGFIDIEVSSIDKYYEVAFENARKWRDDAYLAAFTISVVNENGEIQAISNYEFRSISKPGKWYQIRFLPDYPVRNFIEFAGDFPEGDSRLLPKELDIDKIRFGSEKVLNIAFDNCGIDFIQNQMGYETIIINLEQENSHAAQGDITWVVVFSQKDAHKRLEIDPFSGLVIK